MLRECVTCRFIANCATVDPDKVLAHYVCPNYQEVETQAEVQARCNVITKFGRQGLVILLSLDKEEA